MGLEYKLEARNLDQAELHRFLRRLPEFESDDAGIYFMRTALSATSFSVKCERDHVYVCQFVASRETDALLGLLIRELLSSNDCVVVSEL